MLRRDRAFLALLFVLLGHGHPTTGPASQVDGEPLQGAGLDLSGVPPSGDDELHPLLDRADVRHAPRAATPGRTDAAASGVTKNMGVELYTYARKFSERPRQGLASLAPTTTA